jgi:hypothetical protein
MQKFFVSFFQKRKAFLPARSGMRVMATPAAITRSPYCAGL